jgi:CheY-like chemotaxis protein
MAKINQLLIIDDDEASRVLMAKVAKELFIAKHIIICPTAFKALSFIKENCLPTLTTPDVFCPEIILLDINMPVMNGYDFLEELYNMESLRHKYTSVLFVSSLPDVKEQYNTSKFAILGYLEKPVTAENLSYALKNKLPK